MSVLFATYNVHFGVGQDGVYDLERIVDAIKDADVIAFQEVIRGWPANDFADQAAEIADRLNYHYVYGSTFNVDSSSVGDDGKVINNRRTFGNMVASRWPITTSRTLPLPHNALPGAFDLQRCAVESVVEIPGGPVRVYSVHTSHVSAHQRRPQVLALLEMVRRAPEQGRPWDHTEDLFSAQGLEAIEIPRSAVVMGDLNFSAREPEYPLICGEETAEVGRQARFDQLLDAWVLGGNPEREGQSFMEQPHPEYRIDHVLVTHDLRHAVRRAWIDNETRASDHYPLFVEMDFAT